MSLTMINATLDSAPGFWDDYIEVPALKFQELVLRGYLTARINPNLPKRFRIAPHRTDSYRNRCNQSEALNRDKIVSPTYTQLPQVLIIL